MSDEQLLALLDGVENGLSETAAARIRALIAEVEAEHDRTDRWQDRWQDEADRAEEAEAEVARLRGLLREARDAMWKGRGTPALMARIDAALATEATP
jgi:hypothetical protein